MTEPRDDLVNLVHDTLCDCKDRGYGLTLRGRELEDLADALLAAYPQLAASSTPETQWGYQYYDVPEVVSKTTKQFARHVAENDAAAQVKSRTVYASPWEDAP